MATSLSMCGSPSASPSASDVKLEFDSQTSTVIAHIPMDSEACRPEDKRRRRRGVIIIGVVAGLLLIVVAVVLGLTLRPGTATDTDTLKATFISRCKKLKGYNCENLWCAFEQAYVGKDPCNVPRKAYDPFIAAVDFKPLCNKLMFWSQTKDVVHNFTKNRDSYLTLEDTVLGYVLNGLTWCEKKGSKKTFTTNCPGGRNCENSTIGSFWNRVSTAFADAACGNVTAMLNGTIAKPFSPTSIFASEVKRFDSSRVESLTVVLVTEKSAVTNCTNTSLKDLQKELKQGIKYSCKEVTKAQIQECIPNPERPCGVCC